MIIKLEIECDGCGMTIDGLKDKYQATWRGYFCSECSEQEKNDYIEEEGD